MNTPLQKFLEVTWLKFLWSIKNELLLVVLTVSIFFNLITWLRVIDPNAAPIDPGIFTAPALGLVATTVGYVFGWILIKASMGIIDRWFDGEESKEPGKPFISFEKDWRHAGPVVRLPCFFLLLVSFPVCVALVTLAVR